MTGIFSFGSIPGASWGNKIAGVPGSIAGFFALPSDAHGPDANATQTRYNQERAQIRTDASKVNFGGQTRSGSIMRWDNFASQDLSVLKQKVDNINLESVQNLQAAWTKMSESTETLMKNFRTGIDKALSEDKWQGAARNSAAKGIDEYIVKSAELKHATKLIGAKVDEALSGLEPTKQLVPGVPEHRSGWANVKGFVSGRGWRNDDVAQANAKTEAVRVLTTVYQPVLQETDTKVPVPPQPHNPVNAGGPGVNPPGVTPPPGSRPPGGGGGKPGLGGGTPGSGGGNDGPGNGEDTGSGTDTGAGANSPALTTPTATQPASTTPSSTPTTSPLTTPTVPASTVPSSIGTPAGAGAGGGLGTGGGGGTSGGGTSGGAPALGSPGVGGGAAASGGKGGTGTSGAGAAGRAGAPGFGPMMPPGSRGKGEEEEEHTSPDYLRGDHLTEYIGDDRKTTPQVLGE